jgi:hypothetical protein
MSAAPDGGIIARAQGGGEALSTIAAGARFNSLRFAFYANGGIYYESIMSVIPVSRGRLPFRIPEFQLRLKAVVLRAFPPERKTKL